MSFAKPLDNFPFVRTRKIEDAREALARIYTNPRLELARGATELNSSINTYQLRHIGLCYSTFGAAVDLEFPASGCFAQLFPIRGQGEVVCGTVSSSLTVGTSVTISQEVGHKASLSADYEHLVLRIDARQLTEKLAAMTGTTINEPLRVSPQPNAGCPAARMLQEYLPLLVKTLSGAEPPFPDWWMTQVEQLLMTLFLRSHQHNYSHLLDRDVPEAAPREVVKAEEYIEANAHRGVTLEELAEITGVSTLSLCSAFKKYRGYSPMEFLLLARSGGLGTYS